MEYFSIYIAAINIITFLLYGEDKRRARKKKWRIGENMLVGCALIGGSFGALFGMRVFHHKTKHKKFIFGIPLILAVQIMIYVSCFM